MDLGRQLRALRAASGRTLASVAAEAGLSVPYIANLENGRGNPTVDAIDRLARAHGATLMLHLEPAGGAAVEPAALPASLVRLGRTPRFRRDVQTIAEATGENSAELAGRLLGSLAGLAGRDLAEPDWFRLLDALLLVTLHPHPAK
ncbi:helix-turn-helix transcriptional regulator [Actinoplanes sp. NPDC026619]|uniref:helix-turn-helix domain-containing protein n=1 Tax=Actinoplanes sp. NPDC026619 TaxID=3155798 RepID=UPI0034013E9A